MDCISHHSLHSHIPIHHYTNHTAVTNHSSTLIVLPHLDLIHSPTYKQHTSLHTLRSLVLAPAWHFWAFTIPSDCYFCAWPRTALPWNSEPVLVTSTPAWYCLRLCSASDIPVIARWPLPVWFCLCLNKYINCTWIHTPLTSLYTYNQYHLKLYFHQPLLKSSVSTGLSEIGYSMNISYYQVKTVVLLKWIVHPIFWMKILSLIILPHLRNIN